ncbi:MAG: shikimate kinase [Spirochaetales bacterium]|nr:shikimate kinase [Spirochaetales bacterium]
MRNLLKPVLITGMKHCGKSSVGKQLSEIFNISFYDMDSLLEDIYQKENSKKLSSREIYKEGRDVFQNYEKISAEKLSLKSENSILVSAAGGGLCDNEKAVKILKPSFLFIYIEEKADILFERIIAKGIPAFLSPENPYKDFLELYKKRTNIYNSLSDIKISACGKNIPELCVLTANKLVEEDYAR